MNKWGVRIIAMFFFILAIWDVYALLTGGHTHGAFGFDLGITKDGKPDIDYMAWVEVIICIFIGIQLLRFHPSGRGCALNVLWLLVLFSGFVLIASVITVYGVYTGKVNIGGLTWLNENLRPIAAILLPVGVLIFFLISINFLYREDVELLFKKSVAQQESASTSDVNPS
jgi:hypothetical protein